MKPGTQADLRRHLESECGIVVTRQAISLLVKGNDYRIIKTEGGKIKIEETAKALIDSGFGKRSEMIKLKKEDTKTEPAKIKAPKEAESDIDETGPPTLESSRARISKFKEFQQGEKERINNEILIKKLIDVDDVGEKSFDLWRQVRESMQSQKDRCSLKLQAADTAHEIEQILAEDNRKILESIVNGYQDLDDNSLKKKLVLLLIK